MKKKTYVFVACVLLLLTTCLQVTALEESYNGYTAEELQAQCRYYIETLEDMEPDLLDAVIEGEDDQAAALAGSWKEAREGLGDFLEYGEFEVVRSGKTLTAAQTAVYTERPVMLTCVYSFRAMELTDVTVDRVYTTKEKMKKAGLNTVMCISIVFAVLIIISLLIYAFRFLSAVSIKHTEGTKNTASGQERSAQGQIVKDPKLTAVITAAVAAATETTADVKIQSIRSVKNEQEGRE